MKFLVSTLLLAISNLAVAALSPEATSQLIEKATQVQKRAYAPYSNYLVGAALITSSGKIFTGCNVENASYGLSNCAERTAVFKAVSEGERDIEAIVIMTKEGSLSCGACLQVLHEFSPTMLVIAVDQRGKIHHQTTLGHLMPHAFGSVNAH